MIEKPVVLVLRGVVRDSQGRYLLMQRSSRSKTWPGCWEFPGGKVRPGEAHHDAFIREIQEETGLLASAGKLLSEFEWEREKDTVLYRIFMASDVSGDFRISEEHDAFGWFSVEQMRSLKISPPLLAVAEQL